MVTNLGPLSDPDALAALVGAAVAAFCYILMRAGHAAGDHWGQLECDAVHKQGAGPAGVAACARHVLMLTGIKVAALGAGLGAVGLWPLVDPAYLAAAVALDAVSHYVVDRGAPLRAMAAAIGRTGYITAVTVVRAPERGPDDKGPGTGAFELDQAWHTVFLAAAAVIIGAGAAGVVA